MDLKTKLIANSKDEKKMEMLYEHHPDLFEASKIEALSTIVNRTKLGVKDLAVLSEVFDSSLIKSYINLPSTDPNRESFRGFIELYLEAVAKYHNAESARSFSSSFLQLLKVEIKLHPSTTFFNKAHANVVTLPKSHDRELMITSDIQQIIQANLIQFNEQLRNAPVEQFTYKSEKQKVVFKGPVLETIIQSITSLQNQINLQNWNNKIKTENFLQINLLDNNSLNSATCGNLKEKENETFEFIS